MASVRGMDRHTQRVDSAGLKYCSGCQARKALTDFHVRSASPDGRHAFCKSCRREGRKVVVLVDPEGFKTCTQCKEQKTVADYHTSTQSPDGLQGWCKPCANTGLRQREYKLIAKYGITQAEYEDLLNKQGGCCAICGTNDPLTKVGSHFAVDHCHVTGKVRGLLCVPCNLLLGYAGDSASVLRNAIVYLAQQTAIEL